MQEQNLREGHYTYCKLWQKPVQWLEYSFMKVGYHRARNDVDHWSIELKGISVALGPNRSDMFVPYEPSKTLWTSGDISQELKQTQWSSILLSRNPT